MQQDKIILSRIKETINKIDPSAEIFLYGSRARGTARNDSDWDILILLNQQKITVPTEQKFRHNLFDIEIDTGEVISTYVVSKNDWETIYSITPMYESVKKEGKRL